VTDSFTESIVEQAALAWLESVGWHIAHGTVFVLTPRHIEDSHSRHWPPVQNAEKFEGLSDG